MKSRSGQEHLRILAKEIAKNGWIHQFFAPIGQKEAWIHSREFLEMQDLYPPNRVKVFSEESLAFQPYAIIIRKDFCCKEQLNAAVQQWIAMGLNDFFLERTLSKGKWRKELRKLEWKEEEISGIKLEEIQCAFYLLFIGYTASFIVFLSECAGRRCHFTAIRFDPGT